MHTQQIVNNWLSSLNPGDAGLALDRYGQCQLSDSTGALCNVFVPSADSAGFVLYADVWLLQDKLKAEAYEALLELNLACMHTPGCSLGFDKRLRSLVYFYNRDIAATDMKMFRAIVDNFFIAASEMKQRLSLVFAAQNIQESDGGNSPAVKKRPAERRFPF